MTSTRLPPGELRPHLGEVLGQSSWISVDQPRIDAFAQCTGDHQWIHVDAARAARESPLRGTIAHGFLTLSLLAPSVFEVLADRVRIRQAVNYGLEKVRFLAPVRAGKRVRNHLKLVAVESKGDARTLLTIENTVEIEGEDKPALIAVALVLLLD